MQVSRQRLWRHLRIWLKSRLTFQAVGCGRPMMTSFWTAAGYSAAVNQATKAPQSCATSTHLQLGDW